MTISGNDAAPHVVSAGITLCISSTGNATGDILVNGGTLCNQGTINSGNILISSGAFYNHGNASIDSLLVSGSGAFHNTSSGALSGVRLAVNSNGTISNSGSITEDFVGDSAGFFTNNGSLNINFDFGNGYLSTFANFGYMNIGRDFFNSFNSYFTANCMLTVGRDWYNQATILGAASPSCGGFAIAGASYNSGTIGSASTHVDLCDAGHPVLGIDGNSGTIASTTTYCSCSNNCTLSGILEPRGQSSVLIQKAYPNPAANLLYLNLKSENSEHLQAEVKDMTGKTIFSQPIYARAGETTVSLDVTRLAQGVYVLTILDSHQLTAKQLFTIEK
jgi:hypothetical protein